MFWHYGSAPVLVLADQQELWILENQSSLKSVSSPDYFRAISNLLVNLQVNQVKKK